MIDCITAEDNLTFITVNAINCDESAVSVVLNAVIKAGIRLYPVAAAPSYKSYTAVSFCVKDEDLTAAMVALGGIGAEIDKLYCCITGDVTRISFCADSAAFTNITGALTDDGIKIRFISVCENGICLYVQGGYSDRALNLINKLSNSKG